MKKKSAKHLLMMGMTLLSTVLLSMTAFGAGTEGALTSVDNSGIKGWAWNAGSYDETLNVELHIYKDGSKDACKVLTVPANAYSVEVSKSIGDGYHAFDAKVNWSELGGSSYKVEAYAVTGGDSETETSKMLLPDPIHFTPSEAAATPGTDTTEEYGPGVKKQEEELPPKEPAGQYKKGESLGMFVTTGYCNCQKCSKGSGLTYSGTVPQPNYTLSADIGILPIGTKVMIGDTVYTVEDIGGGVDGHKVDIYYATHQEALAHGKSEQEVFTVIEE